MLLRFSLLVFSASFAIHKSHAPSLALSASLRLAWSKLLLKTRPSTSWSVNEGGGGRSIFCRGLCRGAAAMALAWAAFVLCSGQLPNAWASWEAFVGAFGANAAGRVLAWSARAAPPVVDCAGFALSPTCGSASRARVLGALGSLPAGYVVVGTRWEAVAVAPLSIARDARVAGAL